LVKRLEYDEFVLDELRKVSGTKFNSLLDSLLVPNSRLYIRVNTLKTSPTRIRERLPFLHEDEDFSEALYIEIRGPSKLEERESKVIVDKRTAESVMMGANVYRPGVKRVIGNSRFVNVVSENGIIIAEGELVNQGNLAVKITKSMYSSYPLSDLDELKTGEILLQGKASMYVAYLIDPKPGEKIIDMTAHPGGKLTHIYQLEPKARILGFDHTKRKVQDLRQLTQRLGMHIETYLADSRYLYEDFRISDVDKVLIDPPCSALGLRPKIYDKKNKEDLINLSSYQKQFINAAYKLLKKDGILIYSTCTMTEIENERIVEDERFELEEIIRFYPMVHDITGFFIAKLRKRK